MSKYTLIIKKDARKYRTPLFETNNNTIGLEMQQKEVKICGGWGEGPEGVCCTEKSLRLVGAFAMTNAQKCRPAKDAGSDTCVFVPTRCKPFFGAAADSPGKFTTPAASFWGEQYSEENSVCCSESAHGTQNFPPFYSSPETTFPDLIENFI